MVFGCPIYKRRRRLLLRYKKLVLAPDITGTPASKEHVEAKTMRHLLSLYEIACAEGVCLGHQEVSFIELIPESPASKERVHGMSMPQ